MTTTCLSTQQSLGRVLDLLPTGALVVDSDLVIVEWNRMLVEWTSIAKDAAVGATLTTLFPNVGDQRYLERLTQVFTSGFPATYSAAFHKHFLPCPARHGLDCDLMIQQTEVRRLPESDNFAVITIQDVSFQYLQLDQLKQERADLRRTQDEIAQVNQELVERNKELDDFTRIASHDLQEPLRKITTFGQLFASNLDAELDQENKDYLYYMQDAAKRMKIMIQDLMTLSRAGLQSIEHEQLDLNEIVDGVINLLEIAITEKNTVIEIATLPPLVGDKRLITQLFQNLLGNAIKFSAGSSPRVTVTAEYDDGQWILGVKDNGIGIKPEYQERIFEPFIKLHSRDEYEGTGFGLSICKKVISKHGGRIWVESTLGEGSHFMFSLPKFESTDG